jgi:two-component system, chemotaxis family, chemotaxis protein CheY
MTPAMFDPPEPRPGAENKDGAAEVGLILLIEDDFVLRGSLAVVLQAEGYRVECAANALEALVRLERAPKPSLILLDIMLPYMDGLEFRSLQRATPGLADIPVIVITAVGMRPEVAAELGLRQSFFKPLERPKLLDAIRRHCAPSPA